MKKFFKIICACAAAAVMVVSSGCVNQNEGGENLNGSILDADGVARSLVWRDEFDGSSLDMTKWSFQTGTRDYYGETVGANYWGNNEQQYYTENNLTVSGGELKITARREQMGDREFTSSRILTRGKFFQTYGYFEARIKLPAYQGMWPAFWLLPQPKNENSSDNVYGGWAANGEIDIMEAKGRLADRVDTTIHFGGNYPNNKYNAHTTVLESNIDLWHTYALDWRESRIVWLVDGTEVFRVKNTQWWSSASDNPTAPFDQPFFILLNLAVGGNYDGGVEPEAGFTEASMSVDYVRVYG